MTHNTAPRPSPAIRRRLVPVLVIDNSVRPPAGLAFHSGRYWPDCGAALPAQTVSAEHHTPGHSTHNAKPKGAGAVPQKTPGTDWLAWFLLGALALGSGFGLAAIFPVVPL